MAEDTEFDQVVSGEPWRTSLILATRDGVRLWKLSSGAMELVVPDEYTVGDVDRLQTWIFPYLRAAVAGEPLPYFESDHSPSPVFPEELAARFGWPGDGSHPDVVIPVDGERDRY